MDKIWKMAFCGLGSIGSRHLRNMIQVLDEKEERYVIDWISHVDRAIPLEFQGVIRNVFHYGDEIDDDYDVIFVTNPTNMHFETIKKYQWYTKSLFIEKPIFEKEEEIESINPNCVFYVACPVRYKQVIQYIKVNIDPQDVLSAIAICSSYLPEWRPGTDYRKGYSAIKSMGGGVSLDLIHELDYLKYLFGRPREIYGIRDKVSDLELDSDDVSVYIAKLDKAVIQVYLDYFGRKSVRTLTLFCKEDTIMIDLLKNEINYLNTKRKVEFTEERDDYQKKELRCFIDIVEGRVANENDMENAFQTLRNSFGKV